MAFDLAHELSPEAETVSRAPTAGRDATQPSGPSLGRHAHSPGEIDQRCAGCGYGVAAARIPDRCPMCGSRAWRAAWQPRPSAP